MNSLILVLSMFAAQTDEESSVAGGIVALVGDDVITRTELDRRAQRDLVVGGGPRPGFSKPRFDRRTLDRMIEDLLILQAAARSEGFGAEEEEEKGVAAERRDGEPEWSRSVRRIIPERVVDSEIESRIDQLQSSGLGIDTPQKFYDFVKKTAGLSRESIRGEIRRELAIVTFLRRHVYQRIDRFVSPEESRFYYKTHAKEFTTPIEVSYRQIFLVYDPRNTPILIGLINDGLKKGKSFEEVAKEYSQDYVGSPNLRGQIQTKSFTEIQQYKEPIPSVLRSLKKGTHTMPPVATDRNVLYYFLEDRVEGKPKPYEDAQQEIEDKIRSDRRRLAERLFVRRIKRRTTVKILLPEIATLPLQPKKSDAVSGDVKDVSGEPPAKPPAKPEPKEG